MPTSIVFIPFSRELYDDIVRFSDGKVSPEQLAETLVERWIENSVEVGGEAQWGDRLGAVMQKYAPELYKHRLALAVEQMNEFNKPLVWKEVTIPPGSEVRMAYGADHQYAKIQGGKIVDASGEYSPSEWASKVAGGTSRNAWRDLWFRMPMTKNWVPAQALRSKKGEE